MDVVKKTVSRSMEETLTKHGIDVIVGPAEGRICTMAGVTGWPIASLPLGFADYNGSAFGHHMIGRPGQEEMMLRIANAWNATFPAARKPPPLLVNWGSRSR